MRTAARRRALQVALLVGGLSALGLLCGEQAHAADGALPTTSKTSVTWATSVPSAASTGLPPDGKRTAVRPAHDHALDLPVDTVHDKVVQPVGGLVNSVAEGLAEAEGEAESPSLPGFPAVLPSAGPMDQSTSPELSDRPASSVLPAVPGQTLPAPTTCAPHPASPASRVVPSATEGRESQGPQGRSAVAVPLTDGPRVVAGAVGTGVAEHKSGHGTSHESGHGTSHESGHRAASAGQAPVRHVPPGDPGGVTAGNAVVDNATPRHGDACAVTDNDGTSLRLRAGVAAYATADGTWDRHRDIPVRPG